MRNTNGGIGPVLMTVSVVDFFLCCSVLVLVSNTVVVNVNAQFYGDLRIHDDPANTYEKVQTSNIQRGAFLSGKFEAKPPNEWDAAKGEYFRCACTMAEFASLKAFYEKTGGTRFSNLFVCMYKRLSCAVPLPLPLIFSL